MAAAFFRRRWCINFFHRELCRVVWRPQVALFSSKPWDKKPPRITHFKKAKTQPAVDVAKLLDQIYSQQRPSRAPSAGIKAKPSKASTVSSTKLSDVPQTSSKPTASASASAASTTLNTTLASPPLKELTQDSTAEVVSPGAGAAESHVAAETTETKVQTAAEPISANVVEETIPVAAAEPSIEVAIEPSEETSPPLIETIETRVSSSAAAGSAETVIDVTVDATASGDIAAFIASTADTSAEATIEVIVEAVEAAVEPVMDITTDATQVERSDSAGVSGEPSAESATGGVETIEPLASAVEGLQDPTVDVRVDTTAHPAGALEPSVEPLIDAKVEAAETSVHPQEASEGIAGDASGQLIDITLIETTIEPPVEVTLPLVESVETNASVAMVADTQTGEVQTTRIELGVVSISDSPTEEPTVETTENLPLEAIPSTVVTAGSAAEAAQAEITSSELELIDVPHVAVAETVIETTVESTVDASAPPVVMAGTETEAAQEEASEPEVLEASAAEPVAETIEEISVDASAPPVVMAGTPAEAEPSEVREAAVVESAEEVKIESGTSGMAEESEQMTLDSLTLHSVKSSVDYPQDEELLQAKVTLDEEVEKRAKELLVDAEPPTTAGADQEPVKDLDEALTQWSTLSEELQELEGETDMLVSELVFQIPSAPSTTKVDERTAGGEAMTLESLTLSQVEAEMEVLESEVLQEASQALEKEADALMEEERMEVKMALEDDVVGKEDGDEVDILTQDSISEAAEAIEAELPVLMEAMLGSELGPHQPPDSEGPQKDVVDQEVKVQEVLEAMSLESVTLAEVEASLETLEDETLSQTATLLETEAEVLAGDTKVGEVMWSDVEKTEKMEAVVIESVTIPEAEDLQTDNLMEELLFTVPTGGREAPVQQEEEQPDVQQALDPIQRLFLEKIREYNNLRSLSGGPVEAELQYQRDLSEETAKLQRLYGGGDLSSFPEFTFTEPEMDQDQK